MNADPSPQVPNHPVTAALRAVHSALGSSEAVWETEHDPHWASPCERGQPYQDADGGWRTRWQPVSRLSPRGELPGDFQGLANALETPILEDLCAYYSSFWSAGLDLVAPDGQVSLLQLWNLQDVDRLIENLIGHVLGQRRARAPLTLFFACTEADSDLILSLDNATGAVLLERPGQTPLRTVAPSLAQFLRTLQPMQDPAPNAPDPGKPLA